MSRAVNAAEQLDFTPSKRTARPIDLVHLARQCLGDEHLEYEIMRLFDTTIAAYHQRLLAASTPHELTMALHSMRSAASGVGAWTISELVHATEADLRSGRAVSAEQFDDIAMAVEEVRAFIAEMLSNEPA